MGNFEFFFFIFFRYFLFLFFLSLRTEPGPLPGVPCPGPALKPLTKLKACTSTPPPLPAPFHPIQPQRSPSAPVEQQPARPPAASLVLGPPPARSLDWMTGTSLLLLSLSPKKVRWTKLPHNPGRTSSSRSLPPVPPSSLAFRPSLSPSPLSQPAQQSRVGQLGCSSCRQHVEATQRQRQRVRVRVHRDSQGSHADVREV